MNVQFSPEERGLSSAEVQQKIEAGKVNRTDISTGKTVKEIVRSNLLTYFNLIFLIITILLCVVGSFRNLTFLPVIIGNTLIGIVQEVRAKKVLDKMNLLNAPHAQVIRDGKESRILSEELVEGDTVVLSAGDQICADAQVLSGSIQVNESLLTGEADEVGKEAGNELLSGSFVVSGTCRAVLTHVGADSYISRLTEEAKAMGDGEQSEMIRSINQIVKWMGIAVIPIGIILFVQSFFFNDEPFRKSVVSMVAAVIGMIPEGLYLLTTAALALSTIRLAQRKVLLHDMKSVETLARVDVLCVDKTGTITEPEMKVDLVVPVQIDGKDALSEKELTALLSAYVRASSDNNATMKALSAYVQSLPVSEKGHAKKADAVYPFSSSVKYGGVAFDEKTYLLGAPEFILREDFETVSSQTAPFTEKGSRVLLLAEYEGKDLSGGLTEKAHPLGLIILQNPIRENAAETFSYFREQGVGVKVISGDNPETVSKIAQQAGIENAESYIDASFLDSDEEVEKAAGEYTVFGRVTPARKQQLVRALQSQGHTVAMTGDGVNDILAMKDADCSVAMASGSEAAAQAAQVVLLDSDFAHMPSVVLEGRRVVNNVQRSASLFLVKNIFSLLLSVFSAVFMLTYPLEPAQISLISMFTIGIPGFLLALEPNGERIKGNFLRGVLFRSLPAGITDLLAVGALVVCGNVFSIPSSAIATASTMLLSVVGFMILIKISHPFTKTKWAILIFNVAGLIFCGIFLHQLFAMSEMSSICVLLMIVFAFAAESVFRYLTLLVEWIDRIREKRLHKKEEKSLR